MYTVWKADIREPYMGNTLRVEVLIRMDSLGRIAEVLIATPAEDIQHDAREIQFDESQSFND